MSQGGECMSLTMKLYTLLPGVLRANQNLYFHDMLFCYFYDVTKGYIKLELASFFTMQLQNHRHMLTNNMQR